MKGSFRILSISSCGELSRAQQVGGSIVERDSAQREPPRKGGDLTPRDRLDEDFQMEEWPAREWPGFPLLPGSRNF